MSAALGLAVLGPMMQVRAGQSGRGARARRPAHAGGSRCSSPPPIIALYATPGTTGERKAIGPAAAPPATTSSRASRASAAPTTSTGVAALAAGDRRGHRRPRGRRAHARAPAPRAPRPSRARPWPRARATPPRPPPSRPTRAPPCWPPTPAWRRRSASVGLARRPSDAPREYLARLEAGLGGGRAPAARLTELFERARFSPHPVGEDLRARGHRRPGDACAPSSRRRRERGAHRRSPCSSPPRAVRVLSETLPPLRRAAARRTVRGRRGAPATASAWTAWSSTATSHAGDLHLRLRPILREIAADGLRRRGVELDAAAPGRAGAARAGHLGARAPRSPAARRRLRSRAGAQAPGRRPRRPRGAAAMTEQPHPRHVAAPAEAILDEVERAVVGKREVLELVLLALLADGHVLLEDVPGVAKTLIARSFAAATGPALRPRAVHARPAALRRHRLVGLRPAHGELRVPARARCSATCCSATRSTAPRRRRRPRCWRRWRSARSPPTTAPTRSSAPFLVLATQNPIEYEGTYPLPEAQLDRFLVRLRVGYPTADDEWRMLDARARRGTDAVALHADHRPRRAAAPAGRRRGRPRRRRGRALHGRPRDGHARELGGRGRRQPARLAGAAAPGARAGRAGGARLRRARRRQGRRRAGAGAPARAAPGAVGAPRRRRRRGARGCSTTCRRPPATEPQDDERARVTDAR